MNLVLHLTERCNLRCRYCYYQGKMDYAAGQVLTSDTLEQTLSFLWQRNRELQHNWLNITFFGGEPLLAKDLMWHAVERTLQTRPADQKVGFAINTNGTLLDASTLDALHKHRFRIYLSLDGPAPVQDAQRPTASGQGSFAHLEPWLPRLSRMDTTAIRVLLPDGVEELASSVVWLQRQGFRNVVVTPDFAASWTEPDLEQLELQYRLLGEHWLAQKRAGVPWYLGLFNDKIRLQLEGLSCKDTTCNILDGGMAISVRGEVFPCTRFVTRDPSPYLLGTVQQGLDPERVQVVREFLNSDKQDCRDCALKDRCHAQGCACVSYYTTGGLTEVSPLVCTHERMVSQIADELAFALL